MKETLLPTPISIALDCRPVRPPISGVARYCIELANGLCERPDLEARPIVRRGGNLESIAQLSNEKAGLEVFKHLPPGRMRNLAIESNPRLVARQLRWADVVHETYFARLGGSRNRRLVCTVHDTIPIDFPQFFNRSNRAFSRINLQRQTREADQLIAVSEYTKQRITDITECDPARITVVPNGAPGRLDFDILNAPDQRVAAVLELADPVLLHIGNIEPRKNLGRLFKASRELLDSGYKFKLVLAGRRNFEAQSILSTGETLLGDQLVYLGEVSEDEKWHLLRKSTGLVFPSLYEGFGIPVLEAYRAMTPALFSNTTSLAELTVCPRQTFDPLSTHEIAGRIADLLDDSTAFDDSVRLGSDLVERLTWTNTVELTVEVYRNVVERKD